MDTTSETLITLTQLQQSHILVNVEKVNTTNRNASGFPHSLIKILKQSWAKKPTRPHHRLGQGSDPDEQSFRLAGKQNAQTPNELNTLLASENPCRQIINQYRLIHVVTQGNRFGFPRINDQHVTPDTDINRRWQCHSIEKRTNAESIDQYPIRRQPIPRLYLAAHRR
jgi:hypothetical protein